jgi:hypothetical protein
MGIAAAAVSRAAVSGWQARAALSELNELESRLSRQTQARSLSRLSAGGVEKLVAQASERAGVDRVISISASRQGLDRHIEWESRLSSSLILVRELEKTGALGGLSQLRLSVNDHARGDLRGRATFSQSFAVRSSTSPPPVVTRDVFKNLWKPRLAVAASHPGQVQVKRKKAVDLAKEEAARLREVELQELEKKKQDFESRIMLTGIVNNGRENIAFVDAGASTGQTIMLKNGDQIENARVELIDEKAGIVKLNYQGRFSVVIRLGNSGRKNF